jgi:excisionase family DNA binding protein
MTSIKDKYLTMQTVAEILSCTERHVYDLIVEESLVAIKVGSRAVRVSEQSLIDFIEKRKVNSADLFDPDNETVNSERNTKANYPGSETTRGKDKEQARPEHKEPARSRFLTR